jgi:hypothetical protein
VAPKISAVYIAGFSIYAANDILSCNFLSLRDETKINFIWFIYTPKPINFCQRLAGYGRAAKNIHGSGGYCVTIPGSWLMKM